MKIIDKMDVDIHNRDRRRYNLGIEVLDIAAEQNGVLIQHKTHTCCRCGKTTGSPTGVCRCRELILIKHHISYFPEIVVKICKNCHDDIHNSEWGAPTDSNGDIDFDEFDRNTDYSSENKWWVMYEGYERDTFYLERDTLKTDKYGNKKIIYDGGINPNWSALKSGVGIGICMSCGLPACSFHGCYVENHNCGGGE